MKIIPYLTFGVFLVIAVIGMILLSYLLIWGALVGLVIFAIAYIRMRFFPPKGRAVQNKGNTYDHDDSN